MTIQVHFPLPTKDNFLTWASQMIAALNETFAKIDPTIPPGVIVLWPAGVTIPAAYLPCDGTEYARSVSPSLYKLLGESSPGNFETPTVTSPSGSVAVIRV